MTTSTNYTFTESEFGSFVLETAERIGEHLHEQAFRMERAHVYGVNKGGSVCFLASESDVYDLLDDGGASATVHMFDSCFLVTTGWASPLGANGEVEGAPSEHPKRRRVRLVVAVSDDVENSPVSVANVLTFEDDPDNPILDLGNATGLLAQAVLNFYAREGK